MVPSLSPRVRAVGVTWHLPSLQVELEFWKASRASLEGQVCPQQGLHHVYSKHLAALRMRKRVMFCFKPLLQTSEEVKAQKKT